MEKADLLEYLKAVCDAEEAAYACEETIEALNGELQKSNYATNPPSMPQRTPPELVYPKESGKGCGCLLSVIFGILGVIITGTNVVHNWVYAESSSSVLRSFIALVVVFGLPVVGYFLGVLLLKRSDRNDVNAQNIKLEAKADAEYAEIMKEYEKDMAVYNEKERIKHKLSETISEAIRENKTTLSRIKDLLKKLYGQEIIYPTFQNTIAVHQIRQYLEMGICDKLEGSEGAYAEYMKDVRTSRICDSIEALEEAVVHSLNTIATNQHLLYREMHRVNENITSLQGSMDGGLQKLNDEISKAQEAMNQTIASSSIFSAAVDEKLEDMRKIMLASAQNQYIIQREQFASDWWIRNRLQRP